MSVNSLHMIKHSFAAHLLDGGANILIMLVQKIVDEDDWFTPLFCCTLVPLQLHNYHTS